MSRHGTTALHTAFGSYDMVKKLLEKGADPNVLTANRMSCVGIAIVHFHSQTVDIIKLLLKYNFDIKKYLNEYQTNRYDTIISQICGYGDLECLKFMLKIAQDNNLTDTIDWFHVSNTGYNLIHFAGKNQENNYEMIEYLLNNIFSDYQTFEYNILAMQDSTGYTALHYAAARDYVQIFRLLVSYSSAELYAYDHEGLMPIHHACKRGNIKVLDYILNDKKYNTSRHLNACILKRNRGGEHTSSLVLAVKHSQIECVKMLCNSDNVNILATTQSKTIFDIVLKRQNSKIFDILFKAWCKRHYNSNIPGPIPMWINEIKRKNMNNGKGWQNILATLESMINGDHCGLVQVSILSTATKRYRTSGIKRIKTKHKRQSRNASIISKIHEATCLQCKHTISLADTNIVDCCGICHSQISLSENAVTNDVIYYCSNCNKYICNRCKHRQSLHNILQYYANKEIKVTLAHKLFRDWYEQNKKNVNLMIHLAENQDSLDFACQSEISGKLFQIWCNSNKITRSAVLDKLLCPTTYQRCIDHNDTLLLDLLDQHGFDFRANIDKKYKMNKWTPFVGLCRRPSGGVYVVKLLKKLFEMSKKHNARIDIFAKDESNRTGLENAVMFGTVEVVEYLLSNVYSQSKHDMVDILTTTALTTTATNCMDREGGAPEMPEMNIDRTDGVTHMLFSCCGRNVGISGNQFLSPWHKNRRFEIFKILVKYIGKYHLNCLDAYDKQGWNIVHCLCANNWVSYLQVLHDTFGNSIDWNITTNSKWKGTPLMNAMGASNVNFNIECIRFVANIESIDIATYHCGPKCLDLDEHHRVGERAYIVTPQMTSLEYSCFFGRKIGVVRILFQALMKQLKSTSNNENNRDSKPRIMMNVQLIERLIDLTKQGKKDCIGLKKWKKRYNKENYEKIEALLERIKSKLAENSNDYHTISSLVNYVPKDLTTNKNSKMVNDYANVDAKWDENYNNMLKSRFNNSNSAMPKAMENKLNQLKESNCEKNEDWYILKHLGKGAFGWVDLAIHETLGKRAALKQVKIKHVDENDKEKQHHSSNNSTKSTKKQAYVYQKCHSSYTGNVHDFLCFLALY